MNKRFELQLAFTLSVLALTASPAAATFPGPNGKIAFATYRDGGSEIYVMNPDGSGQVNLTNTAPQFQEYSPAWSPDGTKIAYRRDVFGASSQILVMNADGSGQTTLTGGPDDGGPAWSPDGTKIAYQRSTPGAGGIWVINADGTGPTQITHNITDLDPAWSPDGTRMAFVRTVGPEWTVWVMDADGTNANQIYASSNGIRRPSWSPDSTRILFGAYEDSSDILAVDPDGSNLVNLTDDDVTDESFPCWSPDGTKIVFARDDGSDYDTNEIWIMNADGSGQTQITFSALVDSMPEWSSVPPGSNASSTTIDAASVQYSDLVTLTAHVSPSSASGSVEFFVGGGSVGSSAVAAGTATLGYTTLLPAGGYELVAVFTSSNADYGDSSSDQGAGSNPILTVLREDGAVTPDASNATAVKVAAPGGKASFDLLASIADADDGYDGNVCLAGLSVTLQPVGPGSLLGVAATQVSCSGVGGERVMKASFVNVPVNVYEAAFNVTGNYYTGTGASVVAVYDPSLGFTTGGGRVINPNTGNLVNFGFNVKYQKKGSGAQGQLLYMEHSPAGPVRVKSNVMSSLSIVTGPPVTAIFLGKATVAGAGNYGFMCTVEDNGDPGTNDRFALSVTGAATYTFPLQTIESGNIQLPKTKGKP